VAVVNRSSAPRTSETDRIREIYENEVDRYDRQMGFFERVLFGGDREWVCSQVEGEVLEVGIGTGRNLPFYPDGVRVTGVELSPAMLEIARRRAQELARDVDLRVGDAQQLEFADKSFDTVVITFCLCTIPDDRVAVAEVKRVLRPGGRFVLAEHVRSPATPVRAVQRLIDPLMVRFQGDHVVREPLEHLQHEGFVVDRVERLKWGIVERIAARKPTGDQVTGQQRGRG
jgi:ubiquinone/menaquinone biosynthesis C-methylase UbiE